MTVFGPTVLSPGEEVGGGVNPSSSAIVQEEGLDVGMGLATQGRNHLSPRGLVGFQIRLCVEGYGISWGLATPRPPHGFPRVLGHGGDLKKHL